MTDDEIRAIFTSTFGADRLLRLFGLMTADELRRVGNSVINVGVVLDVEFKRRFPVEYAEWQQQFNDE